MKRIDQMSKEEIANLQRMLIEAGYLPAVNARLRRNDDGIWGSVSAAAYTQYLQANLQDRSTPILVPAPAKPWWQSRRGQGLIKMGVGFVLGVIGNWWEPAARVDTDLLFQTLPALLEALGIGLAGWGATQSAVGAAQAQAPLTLRAPRPAAPGVRRPGAQQVPPDAPEAKSDPHSYWNRKERDPFFHDS